MAEQYFEIKSKEEKREDRIRIENIEKAVKKIWHDTSVLKVISDNLFNDEKLDKRMYKEVREQVSKNLSDMKQEFSNLLKLKK